MGSRRLLSDSIPRDRHGYRKRSRQSAIRLNRGRDFLVSNSDCVYCVQVHRSMLAGECLSRASGVPVLEINLAVHRAIPDVD